MLDVSHDHETPARPAPAAALRVLLVGDDEKGYLVVLKLLAEVYSDAVDLRWLADADRAFYALAHHAADVCLVDYRLGGCSGLEFLQEALLRGCRCPVIMLSGSGDYATEVEAMRAGAADFLDRSAMTSTLLERSIRYALERHRANEARERLAAVVECSEDAIWSTSLDGFILTWNPAAERLFGYSADEIVGGHASTLLPPDRLDDADEALAMVRAGQTVDQPETARIAKDGRPIELSLKVSPLRDRAGTVVGASLIGRDISSRKQLEDQLRRSQRLEAVGRLAGGIAHDFNNLLTVIRGFADIAARRVGEAGPVRGDLDEIRGAAERAGALPRQLLAFCSKQPLRPCVLGLNGVVSDLDKMLRRLIGEDVELVLHLDPALGAVEADPSQIEQVIVNLVVNARDAMPDGGTLTIETRNVSLIGEEPLRGVTPGEYVLLAVCDTGMGMSAETISHIFEPFFTTKEQAQGTGLGLATVYGIVRQSGGFVEASSDPGRGSAFTILLPRVTRRAASPAHCELVEEVPSGSETVLLVEDEHAVRLLAMKVLELGGYTVLAAGDGVEALALAEHSETPIDLVITDLVMPRMGGRELLARLAERHGRCPRVLFISGYPGDAFQGGSPADRPLDYLAKPFSPVAFARKVREVLDGPDESDRLPRSG